MVAPEKIGRWVQRFFRELTDAEQKLIEQLIEHVPFTDENYGGGETLLQRAARGEVGMFILPGPGGVCAATFYELEQLCDGSLNFASLATARFGGDGPRLVDTDAGLLEQLAGKLGCASLSLTTRRAGLVKVLVEQRGWFVGAVTLRKGL